MGCNFETTLPSLKPALSNLLKCKILSENKNPWIRNQICLNWVFLELILRYYCHFWNHHLKTLQMQKFVQNTKSLNLGLILSLLGIFKLQFWEAIVIFGILSHMLKWKSLRKCKNPKFGPKIPYFVIFQLKYCHLNLNQHPWIFKNTKIRSKQKNFKFDTKNVLFEYYRSWIKKNFCNIWNQLSRISQTPNFGSKIEKQKCLISVFIGFKFKKLFYLKSAPSILSKLIFWLIHFILV